MSNALDLDALEKRLAPLSHGPDALRLLQDALKALSGADRQQMLNQHMLCAPIEYALTAPRLSVSIEPFFVLQGDVIRTDAAYVLGHRRIGSPSYIVATSTCDAVIGRRRTATLLEVEPRRQDYAPLERVKSDLSQLTLFRPTRYFYLPPLPDDHPDVLYNVVHLDAQAQCDNAALKMATRRASMTLFGWRTFGALLRTIQVREGEYEVEIRVAAAQP